MSQTKAANVRHLWLPSQRSLCDLAVRRVVKSPAEAEQGNRVADALPACTACILVARMLDKSASELYAGSGNRAYPDQQQALELLGTTWWPWVSSGITQLDGGVYGS